MHFALTDEQAQLRDAAARFIRSALPMASLRQNVESGNPPDPEVWRRMAHELELVGLAVPEDLGGSGASTVESVVVIEQLAQGLYPGPYLSTLLAQRALLASAPSEQRDALLAALASGERAGTVALDPAKGHLEDCVADGMAHGEVRVTASLDGVLNAPDCTCVVVPVVAGNLLRIVAVPITPAEVIPTESLDPTRPMGGIRLDGAIGTVLSSGEEAAKQLEDVRDYARLLIAGELVGISQACLDQSVEHARVREQFGKPLGSFQAIKHRCADVYVAVESAWSATYYAAWAADHSPTELGMAARAAHLLANRSAKVATAATHQIHGAIAFTWEHDTHFFLKRAKATALLLGDPNLELEHIAQTILATRSLEGPHASRA